MIAKRVVPPSQLGLGLNLSTKKTRKREFLDEMDRVVLNRLHGPPERSNRLLRCELQEGVRPYIRAGVAVILLPMMAIRGRGSYLRDVLEVQAIHRITPGPA